MIMNSRNVQFRMQMGENNSGHSGFRTKNVLGKLGCFLLITCREWPVKGHAPFGMGNLYVGCTILGIGGDFV